MERKTWQNLLGIFATSSLMSVLVCAAHAAITDAGWAKKTLLTRTLEVSYFTVMISWCLIIGCICARDYIRDRRKGNE